MKNKSILIIGIALIAMLLVAGCAGKKNQETTEEQNQNPTPPAPTPEPTPEPAPTPPVQETLSPEDFEVTQPADEDITLDETPSVQ